MKRNDVQVEGLEIGGMTAGTVKIGGKEVEIGPDGKVVGQSHDIDADIGGVAREDEE